LLHIAPAIAGLGEGGNRKGGRRKREGEVKKKGMRIRQPQIQTWSGREQRGNVKKIHKKEREDSNAVEILTGQSTKCAQEEWLRGGGKTGNQSNFIEIEGLSNHPSDPAKPQIRRARLLRKVKTK